MADHYLKKVLETASALDSYAKVQPSFLTQVLELRDGLSQEKLIPLFDNLLQIRDSTDGSSDTKNYAYQLQDALLAFSGYTVFSDYIQSKNEKDFRTLDELQAELNDLIGLATVKEQVRSLIAFQKVRKAREQAGLRIPDKTLHLAFLGNPGTGKTTVARIVGRIYRRLGLLSSGHFIEVSRTDLIAGYQGQTALKVKNVIEKAKGGVLFIDEAYSLTENDHADAYGRECLTELTKALEDYRKDLVVIVAGYTEPMNRFFESNPGLKSRFNTFIEFPNYSSDELMQILHQMCRKTDYRLDENVQHLLKETFIQCVTETPKNFANGRYVRNIYEDLIMHQACRISSVPHPTKDDLSVITSDDCPVLKHTNTVNKKSYKFIHSQRASYLRYRDGLRG